MTKLNKSKMNNNEYKLSGRKINEHGSSKQQNHRNDINTTQSKLESG